MRIGRRPLFFLAVAAICFTLLPPTPPEFRWVNLAAAGLALFWAILLSIEEVIAKREGALPPGVVEPNDVFRDERAEREEGRTQPTPFGEPPPPP